uniref:Exonuclease domain-containing protein n=1 Tax=Macrostomum lignano TaxID=282301 RepID=A0A1I8FRF0_9PLAT
LARVQCPAVSGRVRALGREFVCTAASLEFLRRHGLDLNRVVDCGVYYLNEAQEAQLRRLLNAGESPVCCRPPRTRLPRFESLSARRLGCVSSLGVRVALAARLQRPADGCQLLLRCEPPVGGNLGQTGDGYCRAEAAAADTIQPDGCGADSTSAAVLSAPQTMSPRPNRFALRCVGFSRVFRALVNLRKPLVGHNCFLDLLAMYEYFYRPLPVDYEAWKAESFHRLTPLRVCKFNSLPIGSLEEARDALTALDAAGGAGSAPTIRQLGLAESSATSGGRRAAARRRRRSWAAAHRAGWDAFMAGEVFLRVSHRMLLLSLRPPATAASAVSSDSGGVEFALPPTGECWRAGRTASTSSKAKQHCVKLDAPDPKSRRPPVLVLLRRWDGGPIDLLWVRDLVARCRLAGLRT